MTEIHPTAIIDKAAELDPTVQVGPNVVIEGPVRIGPRCRIMANAYLSGRTVLGSDNEVHIGAVLGHTPQHLHYDASQESGLIIGNGNIFREYVTVHRAFHPGHNTIIGDHNFFMGCCHIAHDTRIDNHVIVANGALLAGHTWVEDRAFISGNVTVHQYVCIGTLAMLGGLSKVVKDVPPYMTVDGESVICGLNTVGLRRAGVNATTRDKIKQAYRILYRTGLNVPNAVRELEENLGDVPEVQQIITFIRKSVRGISKHTRSSEI